MSGSSLGGFNIGSDTQLTITSGGAVLASTTLTSFEARQITASLDSVRIDGTNNYRDVERGWEGSFETDRTDSTMDDYFANKEAARYTFGSQPPVVQIFETKMNVDGSISRYRFDYVTLKMDTAGSIKGDDKVNQKISFRCGRRIKV